MEQLKASVQPWTRRAIEKMTGVKAETITALARAFVQARNPLALAGGFSGEQPVETAVAADLLCLIKQGSHRTMDFRDTSSLSDVAPASEMKLLAEQCLGGEVDMLLIHDANPLFSLPSSMDFSRSMAAVPFVVSFSSMPDETSERAHLILPVHTALESWGDYAPRKQVTGLMQPVMGPVANTRHVGDLLIGVGKKYAGPVAFPWADFLHLLQTSWAGRLPLQRRNRDDIKTFWFASLKTGGQWETGRRVDTNLHRATAEYRFPKPSSEARGDTSYHLVAYPTIQFFDGRIRVYDEIIIPVLGIIVLIAVWILLKRTRIGMIIRAGVQDRQMVEALGINVRRVFTLVFALGVGLATFGGVLAAPSSGLNTGMGGSLLTSALIALAIGGLTSYPGAALGSLLVGLVTQFIIKYGQIGINLPFTDAVFKPSPPLVPASTVLLMVIVLLFLPGGIMGKKD